MVTKQEQLEFAAMNIEKWKSGYDFAVIDKTNDGQLCVRWPSICSGCVSKKEWQQERDKISSKPGVDSSWHERGELPPVGATVEKKCKSATIWTEIKIVAAGNQLVIFGYPAGDESVGEWSDYEFRPLRTEREKAIDEMVDIICAGGELSKDGSSAREIAERIYDSKYRKQ